MVINNTNDNPIYFIGDLHGDLKAFNIIMNIISVDKNSIIVVLGDVIDRGKHSFAILQKIFSMINEGKEVYYIRGNHESEATLESFKLYENVSEKEFEQIQSIFNLLPYAVFLQRERIFATHAGFTNNTIFHKFSNYKYLQMDNSALTKDEHMILWTDINENYTGYITSDPKREGGYSFGIAFIDYIFKLNPQVSFIIRGHSHKNKSYDNKIITLVSSFLYGKTIDIVKYEKNNISLKEIRLKHS